MATERQRQKIIDAFMAELADVGFEGVHLTHVAEKAGVTPAQLREAYDGRIAIVADFMRRIDKAVLEGIDKELSEESGRERLFDCLMRRLDAMTPYREAVASLRKSVRRDPALALTLNGLLVTSMRWMMVAADVDQPGLKGLVRAQGLGAVWVKAVDSWLKDEDPGLSATMVEVDKGLRRGERWLGCADRAASFLTDCACRMKKTRRRKAEEPDPAMAAGEGI
ncbi:hypothetical protein HDIA_3515 [Hartmannibacter diazotrophicus]|uniref:HTH tetR-type domain-containing protein n=1 Tax=Hartmannibacter diazotrophicus TaxID=1482074 RepID=A0A2C9D9V3_9HYPH|nr:TetR/AcrR family transcriptional regulator [Hartmannibacter diazotrophicus]SON57056.1 hypothetical protein HDIA_3515 [Hartmannibacter diazotrophicus]